MDDLSQWGFARGIFPFSALAFVAREESEMGETQETWDPHRFLMRVLKKGELSTKNIKYASGQSYLVSFTIYQGWKYLLGGSGFGAIDKRCEKASDAPWSLGEDGGKLCIRSKGKRKPIAEVVDKSCEHMAKLIASACADLPYLRALQFVLWTQHEVYYSGYKPTKNSNGFIGRRAEIQYFA